jgi:hypothetical protein
LILKYQETVDQNYINLLNRLQILHIRCILSKTFP